MDVPLRCRCGAFRARLTGVKPSNSNHARCFCVDCQTFARHLGGDDVLDAWGGTDIRQVSPRCLVIDQGEEQLAALRLSPKGLVRWYTSCCNTPFCNTVAKPRIPFLGVIHTIMDLDDAAVDGVFGPEAAIHTQSATGNHDELAKTESIVRVARVMTLVMSWWIRGHARQDLLYKEGLPRVQPTVLSLEERQRLQEQA